MYTVMACAGQAALATEVTQLKLERTDEAVYLSAAVKFDLPPVVERSPKLLAVVEKPAESELDGGPLERIAEGRLRIVAEADIFLRNASDGQAAPDDTFGQHEILVRPGFRPHDLIEPVHDAPGVDVDLDVVPEMQHVFQFLGGVAPEADAAIARAGLWLKAKLSA